MNVTIWREVVLGHVDPLKQRARVADIHTVDLRLELVIDGGGWCAAKRVRVVVCGERQELDGVSQSKLLHVCSANWDTVHLGEQHVHRCVGKVLTLRLIQIHKVGPGLVLVRGGDTCGPRDAKLDVVVLERHEGQGHVPVLAEEKLERQETSCVVLGTSRIVVQVALRIILSAGDGLKLSHPGDILSVDNLTTDEQLDLVDDGTPVKSRVQSTSRILGDHVDAIDQVTLLLQTDRGDVASCRVTLDQLAFERTGVMRVALVAGTEERNLWLTSQPRVLSTGCDELNDTTRHLQWCEKKDQS